MGKTANDAVFAPATGADDHDSDDETETDPEADDEDDDDCDEGQTETEINENFVNSLINKISLWRRPPLLISSKSIPRTTEYNVIICQSAISHKEFV